jgi:hypothetical protein
MQLHFVGCSAHSTLMHLRNHICTIRRMTERPIPFSPPPIAALEEMAWRALATILECNPDVSKRCLQANMPVLQQVLEKVGRDWQKARPGHKVRLGVLICFVRPWKARLYAATHVYIALLWCSVR